MSESGEYSPYQSLLSKEPLPENEWQQKAQQAAIKFNKENPPNPPLDTSPPEGIYDKKAVLTSSSNPNALATRANADAVDTLLDTAKNEDAHKTTQEAWYKRIFNK